MLCAEKQERIEATQAELLPWGGFLVQFRWTGLQQASLKMGFDNGKLQDFVPNLEDPAFKEHKHKNRFTCRCGNQYHLATATFMLCKIALLSWDPWL